MGNKFSVVIPLYNKEAEIARCLRSVQAQTFTDFEVLIIDDGSEDGGPSIATSFCESDSRFRLVRQTNQGLAAARNKGISLAQTALIALLDADDEWQPDHLARLAELIERHPEAAVFFVAFWIDRGGRWRRPVQLPRHYRNNKGCIVPDFFHLPDGNILPSGTLIRKDALDKVGGYRQMFGEDIDLLLRLAASYQFAYSPTPTAIWHVSAGNRMCVRQAKVHTLYSPGSLNDSLLQITNTNEISQAVKDRASRFVARREKHAIYATVLAGHKEHALYLYKWWQSRFANHSSVLRILIHLPTPLLLLIGTLLSSLRRLRTAMTYFIAALSPYTGLQRS